MSKTVKNLAMVLILVAALVAAYLIVQSGSPALPDMAPATEQPTNEALDPDASLRLVTWNIANFGASKSEEEIQFMAQQLRAYDLVAIQEVSTTPPGPQAVAQLDDALDRTGAAWDYLISDPTEGDGPERYAFLWKPSRLTAQGRGWLETSLAARLDREPFMARFRDKASGQTLLVANFHAVPSAKQPREEIAELDALHARYASDNLIILGDFNLPQRHYAFDELKGLGYDPVVAGEKTSLRMRRRDGEHLANAYDNIFIERSAFLIDRAGVQDFTEAFRTLPQARKISDHLPVYVELAWR